jgi:hypothetical protein
MKVLVIDDGSGLIQKILEMHEIDGQHVTLIEVDSIPRIETEYPSVLRINPVPLPPEEKHPDVTGYYNRKTRNHKHRRQH